MSINAFINPHPVYRHTPLIRDNIMVFKDVPAFSLVGTDTNILQVPDTSIFRISSIIRSNYENPQCEFQWPTECVWNSPVREMFSSCMVSKTVFFQLLVCSVEESSIVTWQFRDGYIMLLYALTEALNIIQGRIAYCYICKPQAKLLQHREC